MEKKPVPNFFLKVNLRCCPACPRKAKQNLEKLHGVVSIAIDRKQGLVSVTGTVDPKILVDKFAEWGKKAVIWSPGKDSSTHQEEKKETKSCQGLADSNSDNDKASKKISNGSIIWQHPDLVPKKAGDSAARMKNWLKFCGLFCKTKKGANAASGQKPSRINGGSTFPSRTKMVGHGRGSMYPPYRPMVPNYRRQAAPPFLYRQPPPLPGYLEPGPMGYGYRRQAEPPFPYYGHPPAHPSMFTPMIHYTSYADNYSSWG